MKDKFCILSVLEGSPLQLAFVRSILTSLVYTEIENNFIISCTKSYKEKLSISLEEEEIKYTIIYVNLKSGCDVFSHGINESDENKIKDIILDR